MSDRLTLEMRSRSGGIVKQSTYQADAFWDTDAAVWVATSDNVPGLATEAKTIEALSQKLRTMIPDLLFANKAVLKQAGLPKAFYRCDGFNSKIQGWLLAWVRDGINSGRYTSSATVTGTAVLSIRKADRGRGDLSPNYSARSASGGRAVLVGITGRSGG